MEVEALGGSLLFIIVALECQHLGIKENTLVRIVVNTIMWGVISVSESKY